MIAKGAHPPMVITHAGGAKFAIQIRSHEIMVDQTVAAGGSDSAPTPLELLGASLGSCIAYYAHQFFHTRGLPADDVRVEITETRAKNPSRIESFQVKLFLPSELPEKYQATVNRILEICPAHNTVISGAKIDVEFVQPVPVEVPA